MGNYHARCGVGENSEITSKNYLSLFNGWDDIAITYTDGHIEKSKEHFYSPQHAIDIVKRLLHHSGMIIDNATPMSQGHLPGNTRITALKEPLVDDDRGISVSIRLLHPSRVNRAELVHGGNSTQKMVDFLCMCLRYGVSFVVAGATSSGKTTLLWMYTIKVDKWYIIVDRKRRNKKWVQKSQVHNTQKNSKRQS